MYVYIYSLNLSHTCKHTHKHNVYTFICLLVALQLQSRIPTGTRYEHVMNTHIYACLLLCNSRSVCAVKKAFIQ